MLQSIREKTTGWIAYAIIFLISVPFVLMGLNSYFGAGEQAPAAVVNGEEIGVRQLDFAYANYQQRLRSMFGGQIPEAFNNEAVLKEQVRNQLIEEEVISQHVVADGYRVGDQLLNQKISAMTVFHENGRFNPELYKAQLSSQGISPVQFEEDLRRSEEMMQIRRAFSATNIVSSQRDTEKQQLNSQQRKIRSLVLPVDLDSVTVTDSDLAEEYEKNGQSYMTIEQVKVDYIELNLDAIKAKIVLSEQDIKNYYEQVEEQLTATEIRTASHILLTVADDASSEETEAKKSLALSLKAKIDAGEDFAQLAKTHSEDPGSAAEGGDLGEVEKGMMVEAFETALFEMNEGDVSDPVRTSFGWHIIKLVSIAGGEKPTYQAARENLIEQLKTEKSESQIYELSESLSNLTYEQPDSLVPASEQLSLEIKTSDWFSRQLGTGIAENQKVRNTAFAAAVLSDGQNSETIELADNNLIVLRLNKHKPSALPPLDDIKKDLISKLKLKKSRLYTAAKGKDGLAKAVDTGLESVASVWGKTIKDSGFVKRGSNADQFDILSLAFKMDKPSGAPVYQGIELPNGDYAIVELSDVKTEVKADTDNAKKPETNFYEYQAWVKAEVDQAEVSKTPLAELQ
ncbi:MAG: SurA N-terminal domain-containing protein [Gammaproteobacteria bacterium]|nr:SurA N-terminal domain-containing protein [Gammaproteobacteria bacterium]